MVSIMSTKKRRIHTGKNKKKSWRKTDIRDVEEYLDDVRHQERTGGILENKKNENLFFVDKSVKKPKKISAIERRRLRKLDKPLKCYSHLQPDDKVQPPTIPNRTVQRKPVFKMKRLAEKGPTKQELQTIARRTKAVRELKKKKVSCQSLRVIDFDLWDNFKDENEDEDPFYLEYTKKKRVKTPKTYTKKPSELPAVIVPHPGASYNPTYEDHQELLGQAYKIELRRENRQMQLHQALDAMFPTVENAPTKETWLTEMSAGLTISKDEEDNDGEEEAVMKDDDKEEEKVTTQPKPKTKKQRRKAKEIKIETRKRKEEKLERIRENEVYKVRSLRKEIKRFDEDVQKRKELKQEEWTERAKTRTKRLGKRYFSNAELEIKLSEELPESLRTLAPEGDGLLDRFLSLQRRNIIEPRLPFQKKTQKKYKPKVYVKRSHKETQQSSGTSR